MSGQRDDLFAQAQSGQRWAQEELVKKHLPLVHSLAARFRVTGIEWDDLVQVGCLGLLKAIARFQPERGFQFSTFAVPTILGEMRDYLRQQGSVKLGRAAQRLVARARQCEEELAQKGLPVTMARLAQNVGVETAELVAAWEAVRQPVSLQGGREAGPAWQELLKDDDNEWIEQVGVRAALQRIPDLERKVIAWRFFRDLTQAEVGRLLGCDQATVSRLERSALALMRKELAE